MGRGVSCAVFHARLERPTLYIIPKLCITGLFAFGHGVCVSISDHRLSLRLMSSRKNNYTHMHLGLDFVSFFVVPSLKQIRNDTC